MSLCIIATELGATTVSRRIGRRGTIFLGSLGSAIVQLWFAFATTRTEWYLSRLLFGAFRGLLWPVLFAEVADAAPPGRHGRAFALFWLYFGVGLLVGPWIGGMIAEAVTLRAPWVLSAVLSLAPLVLGPAISTRRDVPQRGGRRGVLSRTGHRRSCGGIQSGLAFRPRAADRPRGRNPGSPHSAPRRAARLAEPAEEALPLERFFCG